MTYIYSCYCPRCRTWLDNKSTMMMNGIDVPIFVCSCGCRFNLHPDYCEERVRGIQSVGNTVGR